MLAIFTQMAVRFWKGNLFIYHQTSGLMLYIQIKYPERSCSEDNLFNYKQLRAATVILNMEFILTGFHVN
jgi:hypothetical protein